VGVSLTPKQARFVAEYLKDLNGTQAATRAGYSAGTAESQASTLLRNPKVRAAVDEALERRAERVEVKTDDILRELLRLATTDIGQAFDEEGRLKPLHAMPVAVRRAISGIETEELFEGGGAERVRIGNVRKVKFWDKTKALELLGKHLKLFTDKVEHSVDQTLEALVLASMQPPDKEK
jgi:phage terminase small subunit